jgi:hypothetical protein
MPALSDYIGALLSDVTNARLLADLESARIAQLYASHPLLRHMSVPRFRLPNVVLDLPVAVEKTEQPSATTPSHEAWLLLRRKIEEITAQALNQHAISVDQAKLNQDLDGLFNKLEAAASFSAADLIQGADDAVGIVRNAIQAAGKKTNPEIESSLSRQFSLEFLKLHPRPLTLQVSAVTAQLKDVAPPAILARIRMTISEEGVEWTQTNPSDSSSKTLVPE